MRTQGTLLVLVVSMVGAFQCARSQGSDALDTRASADETNADAGTTTTSDPDAAPPPRFCDREPGHGLCLDFDDGVIPSGAPYRRSGTPDVATSPAGSPALHIQSEVKLDPRVGVMLTPTSMLGWEPTFDYNSITCELSVAMTPLDPAMRMTLALLEAKDGATANYVEIEGLVDELNTDLIRIPRGGAPPLYVFDSAPWRIGTMNRVRFHLDASMQSIDNLTTGAHVQQAIGAAPYTSAALRLTNGGWGTSGAVRAGGTVEVFYDDVVCDWE